MRSARPVWSRRERAPGEVKMTTTSNMIAAKPAAVNSAPLTLRLLGGPS